MDVFYDFVTDRANRFFRYPRAIDIVEVSAELARGQPFRIQG